MKEVFIIKEVILQIQINLQLCGKCQKIENMMDPEE